MNIYKVPCIYKRYLMVVHVYAIESNIKLGKNERKNLSMEDISLQRAYRLEK